MIRGLTVVAGGARSGKTERLLEEFRRVQSAAPPGTALWLAPTHRASAAVRERIPAGGLRGCLNPHCLTFDQFARRVIEASDQAIRPVSMMAQRQLLGELIGRALDVGRLRYFAAIAPTAGFLDLLLGFVRQLKRLEIWPHELRAAQGESASAKDRELFHLYDEYQRLLNQHQLYDAEGRLWSARAQLRDGQFQPFGDVRHVFVDGFVDFTRTEHEMLEILAGRVESMSLSLPLELDSPRPHLFAKSAATLDELKRRHDGLVIEQSNKAKALWPALAHVERYVLANPRSVPPGPAPNGIEIVAAAGTTGEVELLARRIKAMLVDDEPAQPRTTERIGPGDVLVVFRSLGDGMAELVQQVFDEYGIPVAIGARPRLARAPIARALAAWLALDAEDWPLRRVLAILTHNLFQPDWPEWQEDRAAVAAGNLVRRLQIPSGRPELFAALAQLASRQNRTPEEQANTPSTLEQQAQIARPLMNRIAAVLDALPRRATLSAWAKALTELATDTGMLRSRVDPGAPARATEADRRAWEQMVLALEESQRVCSWMGRADAELSRRELLAHLKNVLGSLPLWGDYDESGRVRVLSAESARHVTAPYVFVAGLSERAFPPAMREDCLYGESETRQLVAAGLPLDLQAHRRSHEMLLFYQVVTRATRRLVLSYAALDETAQPLSPSPYLSELERVFGPGKLSRTPPSSLSAVPPSDHVYSPRELRVRAVANALDGESGLLETLLNHPAAAAVARNVVAGLKVAGARSRGDTFGPFEGMILSEAAQAVLAEQFGAARCWSPSQLEQYASCPFQFFAQRVLGLEPIEESALAVDYAGRGRMMHWLLAGLHRRLNERSGGRASPGGLSPAQFADEIHALVGQLLADAKRQRPLAAGLLAIDAQRTAAALIDYYQQHARYDALSVEWDEPLRPAHFEVSFGPRPSDDSGAAGGPADTLDPLSSGDPFEFDCGGQTIRFAGRIDRIDLGRLGGQNVFAIIDYKSGRSAGASARAIVEGMALQLPLYALAAEKLLASLRAVPARIGYWHVAARGCKEAVVLHEAAEGGLRASPAWRSLANDLPDRVASLVHGIRDGQFPMASADEQCTSRCPYNTVCRVNQARSLGKQWQPPREASA